MKRMTNLWLVLPLLLAFGGILTQVGCSSDSTTPNDNPPALTSQGAAQQAGQLAYLLDTVLGIIGDVGAKDVYTEPVNYSYTIGTPPDEVTYYVNGAVMMDYRCGGVAGDPCPRDSTETNFLRIYTAVDPPQNISLYQDDIDPGNLLGYVTFNVDVDPYNHPSGSPKSGTVNTNGLDPTDFLNYGIYNGTFEVIDVQWREGSYPGPGTLEYTAPPYFVVVTFVGPAERCANMVVTTDEETEPETYIVDLDTGLLVETCPE